MEQPDGSVIEWEWVRGPRVEAPVSPGAGGVGAGGDRPRGHTFSVPLICKALELVLWANNSIRGAARSLAIVCQEATEACPSLWSIRNWVFRLGLFEVQRPKPWARDWALILDHTIQVGAHKALLVVGVQLEEWDSHGCELGHQDVAVLALEICQQSNGQKVLQTLEQIREQIGGPRLLVSDAGSDLKKAAESFCERHDHTDWIPDVSHRMARLLEAELKADPKWESFLSQAALCRSRCQQTPLSPLMPPAQRGKARWMNYLPLVEWGLKMLHNPIPPQAEPREYRRLFGWLDDYLDDLSQFCLLMNLGQETGRILKQSGIHSQSLQDCRAMLEELALGARLHRYASGIHQYLDEVGSKLRPGERLLASSDIVESLFGKYKFMVDRSPQQAITRLVLSIGALVSKRTPELVRQALETVKMEAVEEWFRKQVGPDAQSIRQAVLG